MNLKELLNKDNPLIFEIGANTGTDTLTFIRDFPNADIVCFEPDKEVYQKLLLATENHPNIRTYNMAIGRSYGTQDFYPSNQGLSGSLRKPKEHLNIYPQVQFYEPYKVEVESLDAYVEFLEFDRVIDLVWADVQGAELDMILGGKKTFSTKVKYLLTEFSKVEMYEGAPTLDNILKNLPDFELVEIVWQWEYDGNCLLRNKNL